jgi:hypothetical protein
MAQLNRTAHHGLAGVMRWLRVFVLACTFAGGMGVATTASAERYVNSLPFTENFNTNNYSDLLWLTQGATHTWLGTGGFNGSGAAKFTGPNAEGYSGLGQFILSMPTKPEQLNVRFLIWHGDLWFELGAGGKLIIMNRDGNRGRPMVIAQDEPDRRWEAWGNCDGTVCRMENGDYWPDGTETFRLGNRNLGGGRRSHEWISVEFEANTRTGMQRLYIDTQDGQFHDVFIERPMDSSGAGGTWSMIDIIGGYMNWGNVRSDPENYFKIDELVINSSRIGPPAGFRSGTTTRPNPPTSLQVQ